MSKPGIMTTVKSYIVDKKWMDFQREAVKFRNAFTKVGLFSGPHSSGEDVVTIAVVHEFGSPKNNIPERSFIRAWTDQNRRKIWNKIEELYDKVLEGKYTARKAIKKLGEWGAGEIKDFMTDLRTPSNAPSTIARKGSSNPLIDSGEMRRAVDHKDYV